MVKVVQMGDDGTELASIELDDFTIEVIYSGLADLLRDAATSRPPAATARCEPSRQGLQRRQRVLGRLRD